MRRAHEMRNVSNLTAVLFQCSTAKEVEAIVRAEGATPATVGVIEGEVRVGLSAEELDHLARCKSSLKVSRRDLPYVVGKVRHKPQDHLGFSSFFFNCFYFSNDIIIVL